MQTTATVTKFCFKTAGSPIWLIS